MERRFGVPGATYHNGKYRALWPWLRSHECNQTDVSFSETEKILGFALPQSCRVTPSIGTATWEMRLPGRSSMLAGEHEASGSTRRPSV